MVPLPVVSLIAAVLVVVAYIFRRTIVVVGDKGGVFFGLSKNTCFWRGFCGVFWVSQKRRVRNPIQ
jgi:hypothetical protein